MRYRKLGVDDDYTGFSGFTQFLVNTPETVAQAVLTVLRLMRGEWFLDVTEGVPYATEILGTGTQATRDLAIQNAILGTQGVTEITQYASQVNAATRAFSVQATIDTVYGSTTVEAVV